MTESSRDLVTGKGAGKMDAIAKGPFAPIYPVIARQILDTCKISQGSCIDIGCGPGHLSIALCAASDLSIDAFDASADMLAVAEKNIQEAGLSGRIRTVCGDVHRMPYPDASADLIVSRGSLFFWEDKKQAFCEIYRVLRPGGRTFVGGGFGTAALKAEITQKMRTIDPEWEEKVAGRLSRQNTDEIRDTLEAAGISRFEILKDDAGFWIVMRK